MSTMMMMLLRCGRGPSVSSQLRGKHVCIAHKIVFSYARQTQWRASVVVEVDHRTICEGGRACTSKVHVHEWRVLRCRRCCYRRRSRCGGSFAEHGCVETASGAAAGQTDCLCIAYTVLIKQPAEELVAVTKIASFSKYGRCYKKHKTNIGKCALDHLYQPEVDGVYA